MIELIKKKITDDYSKSNGSVNVFLNPYSYLLMRRQKAVIEEVDNIYIDGEWLCKFLRWFGVINVRRCSFDNTSLAPVVFKNLDMGKNFGVVGSDQTSNDKFCSWLNIEYPTIKISFRRNGYFKDEDDINKAIEEILNNDVDTFVCGMGTPLQENFIINLKNSGWEGTAFTCGGFIHQTAMKGDKYYPDWIDKYNLRYLYRIFDEPKLIKRYIVDYPLALILFSYDCFK